MKILLFAAAASLMFVPSKPLIEPMFYEEHLMGVIVRSGIVSYQESGKTVYYIPAKVLRTLPISVQPSQ